MAEAAQSHFSVKSFGLGLAGVVAIYGCVFGYLAFKAPVTFSHLEERLASEIITVSQDSLLPAATVMPQSSDMGEAPERDGHADHHSDHHVVAGGDLSAEDSVPPPDSGIIEELGDLIGRRGKMLAPAPLSGLYEETAEGVLPIVNARSKNTPFAAYKKPFLLNRNKPFLVVAVLDFGLSDEVSQSALSFLPSEVSMVISPYASAPDQWQKSARDDGHEIWLHMLAQTEDFPQGDPGPNAFLTNVSFSYNRDRLHWLLSRTSGYAGLAGFTDQTLGQGGDMFKNLVNEVFDRGLGYFELNIGDGVFVKDIAMDRGHPYIANGFVVKDLSAESAALKEIEAAIAREGGAVVSVKPTLKNLEDLKNWIRRLEGRGIQIAPLSALAELNAES